MSHLCLLQIGYFVVFVLLKSMAYAMLLRNIAINFYFTSIARQWSCFTMENILFACLQT